jgi:hypothetical protein
MTNNASNKAINRELIMRNAAFVSIRQRYVLDNAPNDCSDCGTCLVFVIPHSRKPAVSAGKSRRHVLIFTTGMSWLTTRPNVILYIMFTA